jgi:polyhydroxybutyrate depolymerase
MMSYRLAFEIPEKIAAIAPVAGAIPTDILPENISGIPLSVLIISGTHDRLVRWNGGIIGTKRNPRGTAVSVPESVHFWVTRNNCTTTPETTRLPNSYLRDFCRVISEQYHNGDNGTDVVLYTIKRGGHTWPDGYQYLPKILVGRTCRDINANQEIWEFFTCHLKE